MVEKMRVAFDILQSQAALGAELEAERDAALARVAELEANVNNVWAVLEDVVATSAHRTEWIALRLRNLAQELEDRHRPLDEEVPKTKQP